MRLLSAGVVLCALLACDRGPEEKKTGPTMVPGTARPNPVAPPLPRADALPVGLPELPPTNPEPMPLVLTQPGSCDACSLLLKYDFNELKAGKACDLCGAADPTVCEGWPEPGMVPCESYDWLRNCIYARIGYDFNTAAEWRVTFEQESWYVPDPAFRWERVNALQQQNAKTLRELVSARRCVK